jgi:hypothetical protein
MDVIDFVEWYVAPVLLAPTAVVQPPIACNTKEPGWEAGWLPKLSNRLGNRKEDFLRQILAVIWPYSLPEEVLSYRVVVA